MYHVVNDHNRCDELYYLLKKKKKNAKCKIAMAIQLLWGPNHRRRLLVSLDVLLLCYLPSLILVPSS